MSACQEQFKLILEIIVDGYKNFGKIIDPEKYYTVESMIEKGMSINDFEVELDFEENWTEEEGLTIADRVELLRYYAPKIAIDWIFEKYLGTDRYGVSLEPD